MELSLNEIIQATSGEIIVNNKNEQFNKICTDTRKIEKDNIFLALNGENFNGNKYVKDALIKGASIAIIDELCNTLEELDGLGIVIKVENTDKALLSLANFYREKLGLKVVGITGSTGKTSTKDLVAAFLSGKYKVFKTKGNFNNQIGLPLMILELDSSYDVAVLELGMSDLGEIHALAKCARPDIAAITNIGLSHIENLKTRENILKAKMEITDFFNKDNILVLNSEDDYLNKIDSNNYKILKTGYKENFNYIANDIMLTESQTGFTLNSKEGNYKFTLPMVGKHNVLNALLAVGIARSLDVSFDEMKAGLDSFEATSMRLEFINENGFTIVNDCYNASPDSMKAALDVLKSLKGTRKVAILGSMNELGCEAKNAHKAVGEYATDKADVLITTGDFKDCYFEGYKGTEIILFESKEELIESLKTLIEKDDVVLVKASRGIKFEEIVKELVKISF